MLIAIEKKKGKMASNVAPFRYYIMISSLAIIANGFNPHYGLRFFFGKKIVFRQSFYPFTTTSSKKIFAPTILFHERTNNNSNQYDKGKDLRKDDNDEQKSQNSSAQPKNDYKSFLETNSLTVEPIGKISSIYRLCVGTPRQGLLAPNSRGRIDLYPQRISSESVLSLEKYSHIWIVFVFHLNNNQNKKYDHNKKNGRKKNGQLTSKIAPPALGGEKVGIFSTRSPHRPNPIGFTLCKLDFITIPKSTSLDKEDVNSDDKPYSLHISGLDLVDGTPVLDIKPFVPHYDSVGYFNHYNAQSTFRNSNSDEMDENDHEKSSEFDANNINSDNQQQQKNVDKVELPNWVCDGLNRRRKVVFTDKAQNQLETIMKKDELLLSPSKKSKDLLKNYHKMQFYGLSTGRDKSVEDAIQSIKSCIQEVLSVDVRSAWQTKKARKGRFKAERAQRIRKVMGIPSISSSSKSISMDVSDEIIPQNRTSVHVDDEDYLNEMDDEPLKICSQQIDNLLIKYTVADGTIYNSPIPKEEKILSNESINTEGSGADDMITVQEIEQIIV